MRETDNPQMDHLINNMDSDEVPYPRTIRKPAPIDERLAAALADAGFDETDRINAVAAIRPFFPEATA